MKKFLRFLRVLIHGKAYVEQRERFSRGLDRMTEIASKQVETPDFLAKQSKTEQWRLHFLNGGSGDNL